METVTRDSIHLYALCWNEEPMLPFFFQHYDKLVERYYIFDNGSQDRSVELLRANPKVILGSFEVQGDSFVEAARHFYNECWKSSRGQADWVIVCNVDEHLYHPDLRAYLSGLPSDTSLIVPEGYNMISDTYPHAGTPLYEQVQWGARWTILDKPQMFSPNLLDEINFRPGRHSAEPVGHVKTPLTPEVKLLHFKHLGLDYYTRRLGKLREGLRKVDIERGLGTHYCRTNEEKAVSFHTLRREARQVV
jgi:hypothetical protein